MIHVFTLQKLNADTRLFQLKFADAVKLANMLDQLFEGMASGADDEFIAPTIVPEPTSNTLIVTGARDAIKRFFQSSVGGSACVPANCAAEVVAAELNVP